MSRLIRFDAAVLASAISNLRLDPDRFARKTVELSTAAATLPNP